MRTLTVLFALLSFGVSAQDSLLNSQAIKSLDTIKHLGYHMKYPKLAVRNQIQGTVEIRATFDAGCNIVKTEVLKSVGYGCDEEALRVMEAIEQRIKEKGQKCKEGEQLTLPFRFKLS